MQFGRVVDATLMMDKDTGRPRGFGFVTFDSESAVEATLSGPLEILGKPIEVKKAQPRGNMRDDDDSRRKSRAARESKDGDRSGVIEGPSNQIDTIGMTPQMMAQYWQRMQQYFTMMQQQMALANQGPGMTNLGMVGMNPAILHQMQQTKQMQQITNLSGGLQPGVDSNSSNQTGSHAIQNTMNNAILQPTQPVDPSQNGGVIFPASNATQSGTSVVSAVGQVTGNGGLNAQGHYSNVRNGSGPSYNAHDQMAFEQLKYEQQTRRVMENRAFSPYQPGGPTSWEGMYDDVPQPNVPTGPQGGAANRSGVGRGISSAQSGRSAAGNKGPTPQPQSAPPLNAPTGPRNAGKPGANYRGGGRGPHRGFHPYTRS